MTESRHQNAGYTQEPGFVELVCQSNFSFLEGASHPGELVERAVALGLRGLAITDRAGLYGVVRAHRRLRELEQEGHVAPGQFKLLIGAMITLKGLPPLVLIAQNKNGYAHLCTLITRGRLRSPKGSCQLSLDDLLDLHSDQIAIMLDDLSLSPTEFKETWSRPQLRQLQKLYQDRLFVGISRHMNPNQELRNGRILSCAEALGIQAVPTQQVLYHEPERRALQDVLSCVRMGCTLEEAGKRLQPNALRYLKSPTEVSQLFPDHQEAIQRSLDIAASCSFSLDEIRYQYPAEILPEGTPAMEYLRELVAEGVHRRYDTEAPENVRTQIEHELRLIEEMDFPHYFLTVYDLVRFARQKEILCQGRGSAANSAVCYVLGITSVDPAHSELLFERFISKERGEAPDIDIDFEHERREEVIQYLYDKYGRDRAAMACTYVCYRKRSAVREVGKVLGFSSEAIDLLSKMVIHGTRSALEPERFAEAGLDLEQPRVRLYGALATQLMGFPRHLSIHVGGFILSNQAIHQIVPIEQASMPGRTVIQWDKEDLETLGLLKVDILGLGILTCIRKSFELLKEHKNIHLNLAGIPPEDPEVYAQICQADTVGVFQIESRAQMAMLPRLKPKCFYDLVVEVAIIRPGPIQGDMVHPYLKRRQGLEPVTFPHPALKEILGRTYGVPLFQEQIMRLAVAVAGFTPGEADELRRAMGSWRRTGRIQELGVQLMQGMEERGLSSSFAQKILQQVKGFAEYGFPESHAASFALLVYASAYLKRHHPEVYLCALLNSLPMGFYPPRTLVSDAQRHGVCVLPVDVQNTQWDCTLEGYRDGLNTSQHAVRLGMRLVKGMEKKQAHKISLARTQGGPFSSIQDLQKRSRANRSSIETLARANALAGVHSDSSPWSRRHALWVARGLPTQPDLLSYGALDHEPRPSLSPPSPLDEIIADYATTGLSVGQHPIELIRQELQKQRVLRAVDLLNTESGTLVRVAGITIARQRPHTASGVVFLSLEDETGISNIVVWPSLYERYRTEVAHRSVILVHGVLERSGLVANIIAKKLSEISLYNARLTTSARSFH
jgi:error-prone DNA polymerase